MRRTAVAVLVLAINSGQAQAQDLWHTLYGQERAKLTPPARALFDQYSADCMTLPNSVIRARRDWQYLRSQGYTRSQAQKTMIEYGNDVVATQIAPDIPDTVSDEVAWRRVMEVCMHKAAERAAE